MQTIPVRGPDRALVVLTEKGRDVLETNRRSDGVRREVDDRYLHDDRDKDRDRGPRQEFHHGLRRPRELTHDAQVYRAYERDADRLREDDAMIRRVILDNELKREYQEFLQASGISQLFCVSGMLLATEFRKAARLRSR